MTHPLLYQVNARCWLRALAEPGARRITLANVPDELVAGWQRRGFTHIWLLGVWTSGPAARAQALTTAGLLAEFDSALPGWSDRDVVGSPFALAAYTVPRDLGGQSGLQKFRRQLHKHGLKLILDFVPNHVGLDHPWITKQPERFVQANPADVLTVGSRAARAPVRLCHGRDPHFHPWTDTVQLDYRRADTRALMTAELLRVAKLCDGVRCDMAMLLLSDIFAQTWRRHPCRGDIATGEFWSAAIAAVRAQHADFLLLAEAYWDRERDLLKLGFDFAYHKRVTDALYQRPGALQQVLVEATDWLPRGAHFLENHDELRAAGRLEPDPHRVAAFAILTLPGMRLLHEGQLEGFRIRTPVQLTRRPPEAVDAAVQALYERLLAIVAKTAVGRGIGEVLLPRAAWADNPTAKWLVLVQWRADSGEFYLAVANFAPHPSQCYAPLTVANLAQGDWQLFDLLSDQGHERAGAELQTRGLYLDVPAHATQLFQFRPVT